MRTLKDLKDNIEELLEEHPEWENLPIISSSDDEGNSFQKVYNDLTPMQVENIVKDYLDFVFDEDGEILDTDINCICIN